MNASPSTEILDRAVICADHPGALHQQVRQFLREAIDEHFEDGQSFWTEMLLMERLGVSRGTVRQALGELTSEGLIVREASRRTYVRKTAVSALGLLVHRHESDFFIELMQRVAATCIERKLRFELYSVAGRSEMEGLAATIRNSPQDERLILMGAYREADQFVQESLEARGYHTVLLESAGRGASVSTDSEAAVQLAVSHLRELGHERITFMVNEPANRLPVQRKIAEFERLIAAHNLDGRIMLGEQSGGNGAFEIGYQMMPKIWQARPTAIFTASDPGAWAALRWLAERDIRVPAQISVVGFEGVKPDAFTHPPLTTVAHAMDELVKRAFDVLWRAPSQNQRELVAPQLIVRRSTGPASV